MNYDKLGAWAFILGALVVVLASFVTADVGLLKSALVVLGIIVGLLNINDRDITHFLVAVIAILAVGNANFDAVPVFGNLIQKTLQNIVVFVAPAAAITAIKAVYTMASGK
ncbi:MAG: hypothetical protein HY051_02575 [Candidatus Aenigmarchaeota archaeon]|nr:hypothetical protein [Candidatus Aenigmarchaeota archaeon]